MSAAHWQQIKELVDAALDCAPSDRAGFLDRACPDADMRREVESLLRHEVGSEAFLETPPPAASTAPEASAEAASGSEHREELALVGGKLSRYVIQKKLGSGGMGDVFLAHDPNLDRQVALKLLADASEQDEASKKRFLREARSAAALDHPYICKIYEIGRADAKSFIAMEYIEGETLADRLESGPLPLADVVRIASEIAEALVTAHSEGIVHRDLKPSNIMLAAGGHVKVLDFGLAKRVVARGRVDSERETASRLTGEGLTLGTLAYMSPEQVRGQALDARSDVFSFGILLHEMLSGTHPFRKPTSMDTAAAILNQEVPPLTSVNERLLDLVARMLAKQAGGRPLISEVREALGLVLERTEPFEANPSANGRRRLILTLGGLAAGVGVLAVAGTVSLHLTGGLDPARQTSVPPSVAVLPMTNLSEDPLETDYLADGMSQAVTTRLTRAGLRVTPWETTRRYRHSNYGADTMARELNVEAVVVGTFQISGEEILVNLSLVEAESGLPSWADIIVAPYDDIFRTQFQIANAVTSSLKPTLTDEDAEALAAPESRSVDAYDFYLQGAHVIQEGTEEAADVALLFFSRAIELDPEFAEAHVGIGSVHDARYGFGWDGGIASLNLAEASYERALELDAASMRAHRGLIRIHHYRGDSDAILAQGEKSRSAGRPDDVEALLTRAQAYYLGGWVDRALPLYRQVLTIDPVNEAAQFHLVVALALAGELEKVVETADDYFATFGDDERVHNEIAFAHAALGDFERARFHFEIALDQNFPPALLGAGLFFDELGERARSMELWRRGVKLLTPRLEAHPDDTRGGALLACFYALAGDREASIALEKQLLSYDVTPDEIYDLAAVRAKLGDVDRAVELLRYTLQRGRISPRWLRALERASVSPPESEDMNTFRREYQRLEMELRQRYE